MNNDRRVGIIRASILIVVLFVIFFVSWYFLAEYNLASNDRYMSYVGLFSSYIVCLIFFFNIYDCFSIGKRKVTDTIYSFTISCIISALIFYFLDTLAFRFFNSLWYILESLVFQEFLIILWCRYFDKQYYETLVPQKALMLFDDESDVIKFKNINNFSKRYKLIKSIKKPKNIKDIQKYIDKSEVIFISVSNSIFRDKVLTQCVSNNKIAYVMPRAGDIILAGGEYVQESYVPILNVSRSFPFFGFLFVKRVFDIICSLLAMIILSPIMLIVAIVIKLYDGGPAIYSHKRLTKDGKTFNIYKFRSMRVNAESDGVARLVSKNDNRITPVGKVLRSIRFDELPQLFNILKGDMSIVGPRPERPEIAEEYLKTYPAFNLRLQVKAGLTGYAQVYGKYNTEPQDKLKMDLYYVNNMSFLFDIKLILLTVRTIFIKESTESIDSNKKTAAK